VDASSRLQVAAVHSADVSVVAVLLAHLAVALLAGGGGAVVWSHAQWSVDASLVSDVVVHGAGVVVVAVGDDQLALVVVGVALVVVAAVVLALDFLVDAPAVWAAVAGVARRWRGAHNRNLHHSSLAVAFCTLALVAFCSCNELGGNVGDDALAGLGVAELLGADVVVLADFGLVDALARRLAAVVLRACVAVVAVDWHVDAGACLSLAVVDSAWVSIVTVYLLNNAFSSLLAAVGREALVLALADLDGELAALLWAASIDGAGVLVVADNRNLLELSRVGVANVVVALVGPLESLDVVLGESDASFLGVADVLGALVVVSAADGCEDTLS